MYTDKPYINVHVKYGALVVSAVSHDAEILLRSISLNR